MANFTSYPDPIFTPATKLIVAITQDYPALVTTDNGYPVSTDSSHYYSDGLIVRLRIPSSFGMYQADQLTGIITVVTDNTFTVDIDTRGFDPFSVPATITDTFAQVVPVGEISTKFNSAIYNNL